MLNVVMLSVIILSAGVQVFVPSKFFQPSLTLLDQMLKTFLFLQFKLSVCSC
jgi:hypothetical protein